MKKILIKNGYIITVDKDFNIYPNGAVYIEDDKIIELGASNELEKKYSDAQVIDASGKAVLPGLVNTHLHSGLIRGTAEDLALWEWLTKHVDPMHKVVTADNAYAASRLCYGESLLAGTTCVMDMYRHMDRCADAADELGIRAILAPYVADKPGYDYFESIDDNIRLVESRNGSADGRIQVWFGLEHLVYATENTYTRIANLAEKYETGIHTHGDESIDMVQRIMKKYGRLPVQLLHDRGILGSKTVLAHCVWVTPTEIEIMAATGTGVAHCPVSNMKLASGVAPIPECLASGVKVGLGTDGVKENNNLDMFEEMKFASLLQKVHHLDATKMPAEQTLRLATIYGAKTLGLEDEIGSLEKGKKADIILVNIKRPHMTPQLYVNYANIVSNIVHSSSGADVDTVLVNGKIVVENHKILNTDEEELISEANIAARDLIKRREPHVPQNIIVEDIEV
jgi:5-methylthioadenosine/S-adenosylhomocysteine deaminase